MKEHAEIKRLSDMLDALNHKDPTVIQQGNVELITQHMKEKEKLAAEIQRLKEVRVKNLSAEAQNWLNCLSAVLLPRKSKRIWAH